ncbi:efflux RND transporter periplasmic adaptor subunit [bacterium]|nr:efflux RND transporter periplasmic adaptor subunit [candidate division CSSED10-310 bacterium]
MSEKKHGSYIGAAVVSVLLILLFLQMQGYLGHRVAPGRCESVAAMAGEETASLVTQETVEECETAVGTVTSSRQTMISAKVPAHVRSITVASGDVVAKGDLLVVLDDRDLRAKLGQVESNLSAARAGLSQAESAYNRFKNLLADGAVTRAEYEGAEAQYRMAQAKLEEAGKAREELNVMLGYTEIRAPYSGIVVEKMIEEGALAAPGVPLVRLQDPDRLRLEVFIPESRRGMVTLGQSLVVRIDTLDADLTGVVDEIVPNADPRSRSFMVRLVLDDREGLNPGMFGRCRVPIESRTMTLVDADAVYRVGQLEMTQVVLDGRLETRLVRTGAQRGDKLEVLSGLTAGERVVIQPHQGV